MLVEINELEQSNHTIMLNLNRQYEFAKRQATEFMQKGEIAQYFEALLEMKKYKQLMLAVVAN